VTPKVDFSATLGPDSSAPAKSFRIADDTVLPNPNDDEETRRLKDHVRQKFIGKQQRRMSGDQGVDSSEVFDGQFFLCGFP